VPAPAEPGGWAGAGGGHCSPALKRRRVLLPIASEEALAADSPQTVASTGPGSPAQDAPQDDPEPVGPETGLGDPAAPPRPAGLRNLGNTCYLNAVIQAVCSLQEVMAALQVEACRTQLGPGSLVQCTVDLQERLLAAADQQVWSVSPARMRDRFVQAAPAFAGCLQQDAHEFFLEYVNQLDEEIKRQRRLQLQEQVQEGNVRRRDTDESDAPLHFDAEVTKHLTCSDCKVHREVPEHFNDFSLDFCLEGGHTVERMLTAYFEGEEVAVTCEKCGAAGAVLRKLLTRPPRVLALHLKRFRYSTFTGGYEKQSASVEVPAELDLAAHTPQPKPGARRALGARSAQYDLQAAVAHDGASPRSGVWHMYDDSFVQELREDALQRMGSHAYILFYRRRQGAHRSSETSDIERVPVCGGA